MQLKPFLLDAWLDQYEHDIEFNLAASTGQTWTVNFDDDERPKLITALETLSTRIPAHIRLPRIVIFAAAPWKRGQAMPLISSHSDEGDDCLIYFSPTLEDQSQEDVDFTVAHEVAHVTLRHHVNMVLREGESGKSYLEQRAEVEADRLVVAWGYSVPAYRRRGDGQSNQDECQSNEEPRG